MNTKIVKFFNTIVLLTSVMIIVIISIESLSTTITLSTDFILNFHLIVCSIFLIDFFVRMLVSDKKYIFFMYNFPLLVVSIPYINIIDWCNISVSNETHLILRSIPLIRGVYGLIITIGWITRNKIYNLFFSYLITLIGVTYYTSIMFYSVEKDINPLVTQYGDSIWWACMNVTTVGANIFAVTEFGKILTVLIAAAGIMMFPVFTAYITSVYFNNNNSSSKT